MATALTVAQRSQEFVTEGCVRSFCLIQGADFQGCRSRGDWISIVNLRQFRTCVYATGDWYIDFRPPPRPIKISSLDNKHYTSQ